MKLKLSNFLLLLLFSSILQASTTFDTFDFTANATECLNKAASAHQDTSSIINAFSDCLHKKYPSGDTGCNQQVYPSHCQHCDNSKGQSYQNCLVAANISQDLLQSHFNINLPATILNNNEEFAFAVGFFPNAKNCLTSAMNNHKNDPAKTISTNIIKSYSECLRNKYNQNPHHCNQQLFTSICQYCDNSRGPVYQNCLKAARVSQGLLQNHYASDTDKNSGSCSPYKTLEAKLMVRHLQEGIEAYRSGDKKKAYDNQMRVLNNFCPLVEADPYYCIKNLVSCNPANPVYTDGQHGDQPGLSAPELECAFQADEAGCTGCNTMSSSDAQKYCLQVAQYVNSGNPIPHEKGLLDRIKDFITGAGNYVVGKVQHIKDTVTETAKKVINTFSKIIDDATNLKTAITTGVETQINNISSTIDKIKTESLKMPGEATALKNSVESVFNSAVTKSKDFATKTKDQLSDIPIKKILPTIDKFTQNLTAQANKININNIKDTKELSDALNNIFDEIKTLTDETVKNTTDILQTTTENLQSTLSGLIDSDWDISSEHIINLIDYSANIMQDAATAFSSLIGSIKNLVDSAIVLINNLPTVNLDETKGNIDNVLNNITSTVNTINSHINEAQNNIQKIKGVIKKIK